MSGDTTIQLRKLIDPFEVRPGTKVALERDHDPGFRGQWLNKAEGEHALRAGTELLARYQDRLAAQSTYAMLVVIQALDAAGKDGVIKHVLSGVNPQGVDVHSFKVPSAEELSHDYLWRYGQRLPRRGQIVIFNRSHYEEVLVVRVHEELLDRQRLPPTARTGDVWKGRYREINAWERYLVDSGIHVVKLFLNVSREEQRQRFLKRIEAPEHNWKFSSADIREREHWDEYQRALSAMLSHTSTEWAPWYVIPADHKWFERIAVGAVLVSKLLDIDPQYPKLDASAHRELEAAKAQLEAEGPESAHAAPRPS